MAITRVTREQQQAAGFNTPRAFADALADFENNSLNKLANTAGMEREPVQASSDLADIEAGQQVRPQEIPQNQSSQRLLAQFSNLPSAFGGEREQQLDAQQDEFASIVKQLRGRSQFQAEAQERFGIADIESQIRDISADIETKRANLTSELNQLGQQGFRATAVRGQEARARRQVAAEIEGLQAAQAAAEGNLLTAQSAVQRAVDAKYGPVEEEIQIQQQLIEVRKDQMTREQQKRAEKRQAELARLENQIESRRAEEQLVKDLAIQTLRFGANPLEASAILRQPDVTLGDFLNSSLANFMQDPEKQLSMEGKRLANRMKRLQIAQIAMEGVPEEGEKQQEVDKALANLRLVQDLKNSKALSAAVGPISRFTPSVRTVTGFGGDTTTDFSATLDQLVNSLTIENLDLMSGVLSESDIKILQGAATRLNKGLTESAFKEELEKIEETFERTVRNNGITDEQARFYYDLDDTTVGEINQVYGDPVSSEEGFDPSNYFE